MDQKTLVLIGTILTIIFGLLASLIAWFAGGKNLEGPARDAIRQMFNYELTFVIVAIVLGWIPLLGQLLVLILWIVGIVFSIKAFNAANSGTTVKVPCLNLIK